LSDGFGKLAVVGSDSVLPLAAAAGMSIYHYESLLQFTFVISRLIFCLQHHKSQQQNATPVDMAV